MEYKKHANKITLTIKDSGNGFDWTQYLSVDSNRATHTHGRGIAMARLISFDDIIYKGKGNEVECVVKLNPDSHQ